MSRFLTKEDNKNLEKIVNDLIDRIGAGHYLYPYLLKAYHGFDAESNTAATIYEVANIVEVIDVGLAQRLRDMLAEGIRKANYPSAWDKNSENSRDFYVKNNPGSGLQGNKLWTCPGTLSKGPHELSIHDKSIDHIKAVAQHWNEIGHNSDRITRINWYYDISNHAYLCRACNSSRGSGGILYRTITGIHYSN